MISVISFIYNVSAWNPYQISDIKKVESVQAKFTRMVCRKLNIGYSSYQHRLQMLNLETLEIRRVKFDMIIIYKILNNLLDLPFNHFFTLNPSLLLYSLRRHSLSLLKPKLSKTSTRLNFFSYRTINTWNLLPQDIVTSKSLTIFKSKLKIFDLTKIYNSRLSPYY